MAEVQTNDHNDSGKKNKQKKQTLRVDFTPMVDMNMLLITFFMFCTTLLKPQTMRLSMPTKDKVEEEEQNKARQSSAITLLIGGDDKLYYYEGMPEAAYENPDFLREIPYKKKGGEENEENIRTYLIKRNNGTYQKIEELKFQLADEKITEKEFTEKSIEIQDEAMKKLKIAPTVIIKPTELASYKNLVDVIDEMLICHIGAYTILDLSDGDRYLLYKKTSKGEYLSDAQRAAGIK